MKTVVFAALNSSWYQSNPVFYYLRQMIRDLDYEVKMLALNVNDLPMDTLNTLHESGADVLCFSAYIWNRVYLQALLPDLRALLPNTIIVVGGPEAVALKPFADFCIEGAGEAVFRALAESGFQDLPLSIPPLHLRDLPFLYDAKNATELSGKLVYYESSRGCPFRCAYCLSARDERNELRFDIRDAASLQQLSDELDALEALGPRSVKFIDRSFNFHPPFARELWKILLAKERSCEFHFEIYPQLLSEEDIQILEAAPADLIRFEVGIQSTDDAINRACGRNSDWHKSKTMLHALKERTRVLVHADLLCGLPSQDLPSVLDSIDELAPCHPAEIQLGILKILPDTPMREIAQERGWIWSQSPPYTILQTDTFTFEDLRTCEALARILNLYWNKQEFTAEWQQLLQKQGASQVLFALLNRHRELGWSLHSISKAKRAEVFAHIYS